MGCSTVLTTGSWLSPEQVIQERDQGGVLTALLTGETDPVSSPRHSRRMLCVRTESPSLAQVQPKVGEERNSKELGSF